MPNSAIVSGSRKVMHFYENPDTAMLFDLSQDDGEVASIAAAHPETHNQLYDQMMSYLKEVGPRMPKLNPNYEPETYQSAKEYNARIK